MKISIYDLLCELTSFTNVSDNVLEKAKIANIYPSNSPKFKSLLDDYIEGKYDEDPELLVQELTYLLKL